MSFNIFKHKTLKDLNPRQKTELEAVKDLKGQSKPGPAPKKKPFMTPLHFVIVAVASVFTLIVGAIVGMALMGGLGGDIGNLEVNPLILLLILVAWSILECGAVALLIIVAIRWKSPEALFFLMLRIGRKILVRIHDFNGNEQWLEGSVSEDGLTIEYRGKKYGFSPKVFGEGRNSYYKGIDIIDYAANNWVAIGILDALGILSAEAYYKDASNGFKVLPRYNDQLVMRLYTLPESELAEECSLNVSVDRTSITYADLPVTVDIQPLSERLPDETDAAFEKRVAEWNTLYQQKYFEAWNAQYGRRTTTRKDADGKDIVEYTETEEAYKERLKVELEHVYYRVVTAETDALKNEIIRLKKETVGRLITSQVFTYHAAASAMDDRIANDAWMKLQEVTSAERPKEKVPGFFKWVLGSVLVIVAGGIVLALVFWGIGQL